MRAECFKWQEQQIFKKKTLEKNSKGKTFVVLYKLKNCEILEEKKNKYELENNFLISNEAVQSLHL